MDILASIPLIGGFLSVVVPFIVVLGIVVFVHEYGHYIVARWCGIHAETFSLGFGPRLFVWTDKRGTSWQVAAMPLGGYVKFLGDADGSSRADAATMASLDAASRARSFHGAAVWRRMATVAAGPFANFFLSIGLFTFLVLWQGVPKDEVIVADLREIPGADMGIAVGDQIVSLNGQAVAGRGDIGQILAAMPEPGPVDVGVMRDGARLDVVMPYPLTTHVIGTRFFSAARKAGLQPGDYIAAADGQTMTAFDDLRSVVMAAEGAPITLTVIRDGASMEVTLTPREEETLSPDGTVSKAYLIGVSGGLAIDVETERPGVLTALGHGVEQTYQVITLSLTGLWKIVTGALSVQNLQGPIGIAQVSGESAKDGLIDFIVVVASISTAIGLLNLFPVPVLDGGHLVIFGYEAVVGRPPADRVLEVAMSIGLAMVLMLMLFATYNDILRFFA